MSAIIRDKTFLCVFAQSGSNLKQRAENKYYGKEEKGKEGEEDEAPREEAPLVS
jgi:hypothetical protein